MSLHIFLSASTACLPQGRYLLAAEASSAIDRLATSSGNANLRTYYPGAVSAHQAQRIDVSPGQDSSADLAMMTGALTAVSGTVVGLPEGATGNVLLESSGPGRDGGATVVAHAAIDKAGRFVVPRVPPGLLRHDALVGRSVQVRAGQAGTVLCCSSGGL
jgi:hypothetical protein